MNNATGIAGKLETLNSVRWHDFRHALRGNGGNHDASAGPNPEGTLFLSWREITHVVTHFASQEGQTRLLAAFFILFILQIQTDETAIRFGTQLL